MGSPWLTIIGMQEDGPDGLGAAARAALKDADIIFGGPRHLMLAGAGERGREWPRPFSVAPVLEARGRRVVVLASGDPFHHGAGSSLAAHLDPGEWRSLPAPSTFSLAANRLGWPLEGCLCRALHAAPPETVAGDLTTDARLIALMRDGAAIHDLARWLAGRGIVARLTVCEHLGGPAERIRPYDPAASYDAPVSLAVHVTQADAPSPAPGRPADSYRHDGQITKPQVRAITLAALAPRAGEMLWDLGAGSGSVAVEWCRLGGHAVAVEARADRCAAIAANIADFGLQGRMRAVTSDHAAAIPDLPAPDAVFVGGGFSRALFDEIRRHAPHARLTVNAVTLETEHLLASLHAHHGGQLLRVEIAQARPLGRAQAWVPARPVVQWSLP
ncbi:precorrin-6y C5,15-methyltransferase (decarboxylating) subunit CbiE [uncultured Paracoccus sp.]|uniref:precorrin-6y C5,15-methyltransferase (decarboxylating) subunit CbiE n=1 Tax=uncultured Paracoccus sp. TaxID=189685 RepID=UPI0025CF9A31|nr:precorrin-6y C5,15-methyltransferase (decarboxylating) subunit CbiE [uncultured Paracoccus sp.]